MRIAVVFAALVAASTALASTDGLRGFQTPSHNIVCGAFTEGAGGSLRCDISSGLVPKPARPKNCEFDYGATLALSAKGRVQIGCVSDVVLPNPAKAPVLAYGKTFAYGPFRCSSATTGVTCRNAAGHGFFLSRQSWHPV